MRNAFLLVVLLSLTTVVRSADKPDAKPAPAVAEEMKPVIVARKFLRLLGESKDKEAYELTTEGYRQAHTAAEFEREANTVRESQSTLADAPPPVSGWVLIAPKEGEPKSAILTTSISAGIRTQGPRRGRPTGMGFKLTESDGRWLISEFRQLQIGKELYTYEDPIRRAGRKNGAKQVTSVLKGRVTAAVGGSFTMKLVSADKKNPEPAAPVVEMTFAIDEKTAVALGSAISERQSPLGEPMRAYQFSKATLDDIKPGRLATVNATEDNARAYTVEMLIDSDDTPGL